MSWNCAKKCHGKIVIEPETTTTDYTENVLLVVDRKKHISKKLGSSALKNINIENQGQYKSVWKIYIKKCNFSLDTIFP